VTGLLACMTRSQGVPHGMYWLKMRSELGVTPESRRLEEVTTTGSGPICLPFEANHATHTFRRGTRISVPHGLLATVRISSAGHEDIPGSGCIPWVPSSLSIAKLPPWARTVQESVHPMRLRSAILQERLTIGKSVGSCGYV